MHKVLINFAENGNSCEILIMHRGVVLLREDGISFYDCNSAILLALNY